MNKIRKTSWNTSAGEAQTLDSTGLHRGRNLRSSNQANQENHGSDIFKGFGL